MIYYGSNSESAHITLEEVVTKGKRYLRGQDLIQKDNVLYLYNIKQEPLLNYQKYANEIQVDLVEYEVSAEMQEKYNFPTLPRDEVIAVGIAWQYTDMTWTRSFHIPGSGGGGGFTMSSVELSKTLGGHKVNQSSVSFKPTTVSSFPYTNSFESGFSNWENKGNFDFIITNTPSAKPNTGPSSASQGTHYLTAISNDLVSKTFVIESPAFNLISFDSCNLIFDYHMYGQEITTLTFQATTDGTNWYTVWQRSGNQQNKWLTASVDLSGGNDFRTSKN